ncbi:hypothetical protein FD30_GL000230 [Levilactobacillus namurensis DSM 19117]|uniref:Uncharacterized protein n=1 Tax=Levilactobacillus namurensis DSM 19117 TaxID=1423773 RepID=A0A0R1K1Z0_9LACO|nr:hypothetical protein FD30_GL000230 [Levilactobacillus namurensis DSM 19117]GEO73936.1 hypothetical protein LNA02_06340 [Levilactobacillus namurensis]
MTVETKAVSPSPFEWDVVAGSGCAESAAVSVFIMDFLSCSQTQIKGVNGQFPVSFIAKIPVKD